METYHQELENNESNYINRYLPYIVLFSLILFLHFFMGTFGDDIGFRDRLTNRTIIDLMIWRYNTMTPRVIIDSVVSLLARHTLIWSILDSLIFTLDAYYIVKIVNKHNIKNITIIGILLILLYPFCDLSTAGWIASTINCLWPFTFGLMSFIPLINEIRNERTSGFGYFISTLCLIFAANQEQCCALILGFNFLYLLYSILYKKKINPYNILSIIITIVSFIFILKCPGVSLRYAMEVKTWYPEYVNFGIVEKLYLGTVPTFKILLQNKIVFPLFYIILNISIALKFKNILLKIFSCLNIIFILSITIFEPFTILILPGMQNVFTTLYLSKLPNLMDPATLIVIGICIYLLISSCILLYKTFDNLLPPIIFIAGFLSRLILGFSPTIFASSTRTAIYFYMLIIMLTLMLIEKLYEDNKINKKWEMKMIILFGILSFLNYINIFIGIH